MKNPEILKQHFQGILNDLKLILNQHKEEVQIYNEIPTSLQALRLEAILQEVEDRLIIGIKNFEDRIKQG